MINKDNDYKNSSDIFLDLVEWINSRNVEYAIVSRMREYPRILSDVDFVTENEKEFINSVIEFCLGNSLLLVNVYPHATGIRCDIVKLPKNNKLLLHFPGPDILIFATWRLKRDTEFSFRDALKRRVFDKKKFYKFSIDDMFLFYFIKRIDKRDIGKAQFRELKSAWKFVSQEMKHKIEAMWGKDAFEAITYSLNKKTNKNLLGNIELFNRTLKNNSTISLSRLFYRIKRIPIRLFSPSGFQVVFLGPDGSGKSTVLNEVMKDIEPVFRRRSYFHLFPSLGSTGNGEPVTEPHGLKPRNLPVSLVKLLLWLYRYWTGYLRRIYPAKIKSTAVYFDRYYHDILVDPKRYRYGGPMWLARLVGKLVPKPDLWILLDAPAEVLQARKQEVPFEETARQREAYLDLVKGFKNSVVIDASQPLDDVVADTNRAILEFMAKRTEKRLARSIRK